MAGEKLELPVSPTEEDLKKVKGALFDQAAWSRIAQCNQIKRELKAQRIERGRNERGESYWDLVEKKANEMINKEFSGYNDWAIAMMGIINALNILAEAESNDPIEFAPLMKIGELIGNGIQYLSLKMGASQDKLELPRLEFAVNLDKDGNIKSKVSKDGELNEQLTEYFDVGIVAWAKSIGCEIEDAAIKKDPDGNVMTPKKFLELSNDSEEGLAKFLSGKFDMNVHYQPPTAAPAA
jgi:hypothetical protein